MPPSIPNDYQYARTPAEIERAANGLKAIDAPQAIAPLAQLDRRAPGWLVIQLSLITTLLVSLAGLTLVVAAATSGAWWIIIFINQSLRIFYPNWMAGWWLLWAGLAALWLWGDERLRGLLKDERFTLSRANLTLPGLIALWPFRLLAYALRLGVAVCFLTLMLALPILASLAIATTWTRWQAGEVTATQAELLPFGFAAGGIYLLFGLFIFGQWPRDANSRRSVSAKQKWKEFFIALSVAAALGWLARMASPVNQDLTGSATGLIMFILLFRFLRARSRTSPTDVSWVKNINGIRLTSRQIGFLKFTLFLFSLLGAGVVLMTVVEQWGAIRLMLPLAWQAILREWYRSNLDPRMSSYSAVEAWYVGAALAGVAGALALVYGTGWGIRLAKPFAWPFFWLRSVVENLLARVRARLAVGAAIKHHRERNRRLVGQHGNRAVCREHLAYFKAQHASLSYNRRWTYWWCPECYSDAQAIAGIHVVRGVFDQSMVEALHPENGALHVNLLHCADNRLPLPRDLHEIRVDFVPDVHDIEAFVVKYEEFARQRRLNLKNIRLKIEATANPEAGILRMLRDKFRK